MMERVPRSLLALTVIVVVVALYVGIEDYVQQKNAPPPVSTSAATAGDAHAKTEGEKTASAKTARIRVRASKGNAAATARVAANQRSSVNQESNSGVQDQLVNDNASSTTTAADDVGEGAIGQENRGNKLDARTAMSELTAQCVPLPNVTNPEDVDAPYYLNWAREYWCYDSTPSGVARGN